MTRPAAFRRDVVVAFIAPSSPCGIIHELGAECVPPRALPISASSGRAKTG